jgi:hypothetical protein
MNRIVKVMAAGFFGVLAAGSLPGQMQGQVKPVQGQNPQPSKLYSPFGQTAWFANQDIRQHLKFNDKQYDQLNRAYGNAWAAYQKGVGSLPMTLTPEQRDQRIQELQRDFYKNYSAATNDIITDPQMRARYKQLYLQYRGYDAFYDPQVQEKLALTDAQRQMLKQYHQEWNKSMGEMYGDFQSNPDAVSKRFSEMRKRDIERTEKLLNEQQRQTWRQMIGDPYNFQPNVYFPAAENSGK